SFARAHRSELVETFGCDHEHVALLRFVAPDLERRHAWLVGWNVSQLDATAPIAVSDRLRNGIRQTTSAHIVNEQDRVFFATPPALVDHLLCAALYFRIAALHGREIELLRACAALD